MGIFQGIEGDLPHIFEGDYLDFKGLAHHILRELLHLLQIFLCLTDYCHLIEVIFRYRKQHFDESIAAECFILAEVSGAIFLDCLDPVNRLVILPLQDHIEDLDYQDRDVHAPAVLGEDWGFVDELPNPEFSEVGVVRGGLDKT